MSRYLTSAAILLLAGSALGQFQPGVPSPPPPQPAATCQQGTTGCIIAGNLFCLDEQLVSCVPTPDEGNLACVASQTAVCKHPSIGYVCINPDVVGCTTDGQLFDIATKTLIDLNQPQNVPPPQPPIPTQPPVPVNTINTINGGFNGVNTQVQPTTTPTIALQVPPQGQGQGQGQPQQPFINTGFAGGFNSANNGNSNVFSNGNINGNNGNNGNTHVFNGNTGITGGLNLPNNAVPGQF